jgi:hypothetical protein
MSSYDDGGKLLDQAEVAVQTEDMITMRYTSVESSKSIGLNLKRLSQERWLLSNGHSTRRITLPDIMPLEVISAIGAAGYMANKWLVKKTVNPTTAGFSGLPSIEATMAAASKQTSASTQTLCINHDLKCSDNAIMSFTSHGTSVRRHVPCVGDVDINVLDCCKQHDVSLWCAGSALEAANANAAVVDCIASMIIAATQRSYDQSNDWWCKLKKFFVGVWDGIVALATELIAEIVAVIGEALTIALEIVTLGFAPQDWIDWLQSRGSFVLSPELMNLHGEHSKSCLCGGTIPTTICSGQLIDGRYELNPCRDVCKEMGKAESCYPCGWNCKYGDDGKLIGTFYDPGPKLDESECCPGTTRSCNPPVPDCPGCSPSCFWACDHTHGEWIYEHDIHDTKTFHLPCCTQPPKPTTPCLKGPTHRGPRGG